MSFVAVAIGGSAVLGYAASSKASDRASEAANNSTQAASAAAQLQYDLGKETLDFQKEYYKDTLKPIQEADLKLRQDLQAELLPSLKQQREFAAEQNKYYKDTFQPVEKQMVKDATEYDSAANMERRMGIASANVNQQFSNAQAQSARALSRYGINPNSSAFARENAKLTNAQALASSGAQTGAAFDTLDKGIALRAGAANFGRNMPNTAAAFYANSNQTAGTSAGISTGGVNNAVSAVGPMNTGAGIASNAFNSAGAINNNAFQNNMAYFNAQQNGISGLFNGIGNFASSKMGSNALGTFGDRVGAAWNDWSMNANGGFGTGSQYGNQDIGGFLADGGEVNGVVRGPGGPRDDLVPVNLSNNEFVLNEGAVKHFGLAKLNKMNEIGLQNQASRGLIRRA
jgi:hypothetical protein